MGGGGAVVSLIFVIMATFSTIHQCGAETEQTSQSGNKCINLVKLQHFLKCESFQHPTETVKQLQIVKNTFLNQKYVTAWLITVQMLIKFSALFAESSFP